MIDISLLVEDLSVENTGYAVEKMFDLVEKIERKGIEVCWLSDTAFALLDEEEEELEEELKEIVEQYEDEDEMER